MSAREKSDQPKLQLHHGPIEIERKFLVSARYAEIKWIEAFRHSWMRENRVAQNGVGKSSEHGHLHGSHYLPRFRPDHRKTSISAFKNSRAPVNGSVNDLSIA